MTFQKMPNFERVQLVNSIEGARSLRKLPSTSVLDTDYQNIDVEFDPSAPIFWCWMRPLGKPIVTNELLVDLKALHRSLPAILDARSDKPVDYYVFASKARGTYSLGGDLSFFAECIRSSDREAIYAYAHRCIDVVWQHVITFKKVKKE